MRPVAFFILASVFVIGALAQVRPEDAVLLKAKAPHISAGLESGRYESNQLKEHKILPPMVVVTREPESTSYPKAKPVRSAAEASDIPMAVIHPRVAEEPNN